MNKSKMKPILFSTPMVQAILDDKKTQTRRVMKTPCGSPVGVVIPELGFAYGGKVVGESGNSDNPLGFMTPVGIVRPRYQVGDILWVRETWARVNYTAIGGGAGHYFIYRADDPDNDVENWRPSIHMPKEAARIFLKVTGVRCERLQDINENDVLAEGITLCENSPEESCESAKNNQCFCPLNATVFRKLWDSINAKRGYPWESNPWVWVYEFERVQPTGKHHHDGMSLEPIYEFERCEKPEVSK